MSQMLCFWIKPSTPRSPRCFTSTPKTLVLFHVSYHLCPSPISCPSLRLQDFLLPVANDEPWGKALLLGYELVSPAWFIGMGILLTLFLMTPAPLVVRGRPQCPSPWTILDYSLHIGSFRASCLGSGFSFLSSISPACFSCMAP